jgi:hypothetical protein
MPESSLIDMLIAGAGAVVAWFVKSTREDNKEQDRKIETLQREQAGLLSRIECLDNVTRIRLQTLSQYDLAQAGKMGARHFRELRHVNSRGTTS